MRTSYLLLALLSVGACVVLCDTRAAYPASNEGDKAVGIDKRVPWTTSRVKGSPEPPPLCSPSSTVGATLCSSAAT
jgi:hypothetical protein